MDTKQIAILTLGAVALGTSLIMAVENYSVNKMKLKFIEKHGTTPEAMAEQVAVKLAKK